MPVCVLPNTNEGQIDKVYHFIKVPRSDSVPAQANLHLRDLQVHLILLPSKYTQIHLISCADGKEFFSEEYDSSAASSICKTQVKSPRVP